MDLKHWKSIIATLADRELNVHTLKSNFRKYVQRLLKIILLNFNIVCIKMNFLKNVFKGAIPQRENSFTLGKCLVILNSVSKIIFDKYELMFLKSNDLITYEWFQISWLTKPKNQ